MSEITDKIKLGEIDINSTQNFFSTVIKGFIYDLRSNLYLHGEQINHFILNSGDDIMYLENKGQDFSVEPLSISNEDYIYNKIPRAIIEIGNMNIVGDQLTNPYTRGNFELEYDDILYSLTAEFRRMPVTMSINVKYYLDSYTDALDVIQKILQKMAFVRTFKVIYLGKSIICSYKIPESMEAEKNIQIDGGTTDSKYKTIQMDFEIETNYPIFEPRTVIDSGHVIKTIIHQIDTQTDNKIINKII